MAHDETLPLPGEKEDGAKARFSDKIQTPWRVVMIGDNPGRFIESEIVQSLNPACAIQDPAWIKPGLCAWDHWWSGEVKMETAVIKEYIDFASAQGWPYMLIDWQWYGPFNQAQADITKPAPQVNMPEILDYARKKMYVFGFGYIVPTLIAITPMRKLSHCMSAGASPA
ncbi:glycoside hydrolase family 97 N-terminal domain-containing protein [Sphingobacterium sp. E70]|nr:glycoside hydrolase family 97 N-terminal domain-containing protein [Sphingobacterium sp. E70]ULT29135.1 glycoside hydrolase family 97 N-terminal domain-containing protein [Sphingobacterium sp. E70]